MNEQLNQIRDQQRQTWDKFSSGWKKWDEVVLGWLAPVGEELLQGARLEPTTRVLDIAAGTGEPGLTAATRVPKGHVVVTDLSEHMLVVAAENARRRGITNFETRQCDVCALPFVDAHFDAVTCRFGFMFFPDIDLALREMVRVTKRGARISSAVWSGPEKNAWATTILKTIAAHVELPAPPPGAPGLFRCAEPGFMAEAYRRAGLKNVTEKEVFGEMTVESPEQYWEMMNEVAAPVVGGLAKADAQTREKIRNTVIELASKSSSGGRTRLKSSATVIAGER